jgi:hypothetical protein
MGKIRRILPVAVLCIACYGQTPPVTILEVDLENTVLYVNDVSDPLKLGSLPGVTPLASNYNQLFKWAVSLGDIVAVNGKPAKGLWVIRSIAPRYTAIYTPGRAISDVSGNCVQDAHFSFLQPDGTPIGTIVTMGLGGAPPAPGAPTAITYHDTVVVGGSGPFLGARGYRGMVRRAMRTASMAGDPANRRINGGGARREILHLIPMAWPEVWTLPTGPAIFHGADFSPVTVEKPARVGELLIMGVKGLGPVKGKLDPGQPFPAGDLLEVNSPVEVTVNGKPAAVVIKVGWPTMTDVYRVDFVVPDGTAPGMASVVPTVAWINGSEVKIPVK